MKNVVMAGLKGLRYTIMGCNLNQHGHDIMVLNDIIETIEEYWKE